MDEVQLRAVKEVDLPTLFEFHSDPVANRMAAFTVEDPSDRTNFMEHWQRILADEEILKKTILFKNQVAGFIVNFNRSSHSEIGYWVGREFWGKGIATIALSLFLQDITELPLFAFVAWDNIRSIKVLEKCGFQVYRHGKEYSDARKEEVEEVIYKLDHPSPTRNTI